MKRLVTLGCAFMAFMAVIAMSSACSQAAPSTTQPTAAPAASTPTKAPEAAKPTVATSPAKSIDFPTKGKSVSFLVAFPAGGSTDVGARLLAPLMEKELGTPVQVQNRAGAGGQVGFAELAQAKPDGYMLGYVNLPSIITMYLDPERKAPFTRKSFAPLSMHVVDPSVVWVKADSPHKDLGELVQAAKSKPNTVKIGSDGVMTEDHLAILQIEKLTGAKFATVQFDGAAPSLTALLGGHIDAKCGNVGDYVSQFKNGAVRALAVFDTEESKFLPNVKTGKAQGVNLVSSSSRGIALPAGTPNEIIAVLGQAIKKSMADADHNKKMDDSGLTLRYMDPTQFDKYWADFEEQVKPLMDLAR